MGNRDYYDTNAYQRPDRPDSGARWFVLGVVVMLLVIIILGVWG